MNCVLRLELTLLFWMFDTVELLVKSCSSFETILSKTFYFI